MDKRALYLSIFAVGMVLLFLLEPFAMAMFNSRSTPKDSDTMGNSTAFNFIGTGYSNITVVRYEPYVIVNEPSEDSESIAKNLISLGIASYSFMKDNALVVSLKSSKSVPKVAEEFEKANYTVIATAHITTSQSVRVVNKEGKELIAEGNSAIMKIRPIYEEGLFYPASFPARVDGNKLTGIGAISPISSLISNVKTNASILEEPSVFYAVLIPWENRVAAKPLVKDSGASFKEQSFVRVNGATKGELSFALAGEYYITEIQDGLISVNNDFADKEALNALLSEKGFSPEFPPSFAFFSNQTDKNAAESLIKRLAESNISSELQEKWVAQVYLPLEIEDSGTVYYLSKKDSVVRIEGEGAPPSSGSLEIEVSFHAVGKKILRILSANYANKKN